jgi:microcompartment protein CcmL/EutN
LNKSIALIEFSKIAVGIKAADTMLKATEIELVHSKFICPGKYSILISGDLSAVEASLFSGLETGEKEKAVVESFLIANVADSVMQLIETGHNGLKNLKSLGILEYNNIASAIKAADTAVKASEIELVKLRLAMAVGGKGILIFTGDTEACKQALNSVKNKINDRYLISKVLISSPSEKLKDKLLK